MSSANRSNKPPKPTELTVVGSDCLSDNDAITHQLESLSISNPLCYSGSRTSFSTNLQKISPSDFVKLQRMRSSTLACKKNTTLKNSSNKNHTLFDDLINTNESNDSDFSEISTSDGRCKSLNSAETGSQIKIKKQSPKNEKLEEKEVAFGEEKDEVMIARGPVRNVHTAVNHPPHVARNHCVIRQYPYSSAQNCFTCTGYHFGHDLTNSCLENADRMNLPSTSSTPETIQSDLGYSSSSPQHQVSPRSNSSPFVKQCVAGNSLLPDDLSDFILKYSRGYHSGVSSQFENTITPCSGDNSNICDFTQPTYISPLYRILVEEECESPLSARSVPQCSPVLPRTKAQVAPEEPSSSSSPLITTRVDDSVELIIKKPYNKNYPTSRPAKDRLRSMIGAEEMSEAWAWTCKCVQDLKGSLFYQDPDGDTLLHIVVQHNDIAKIYALVEQMLKMCSESSIRSFDIPNKSNVTPLYLAVEKQAPEIVAYFLEAGANPNFQTYNFDRRTPIHHAISYGLIEIIELLCASRTINLNLTDGMGLTPLLLSVKNRAVISNGKNSTDVDMKRIILLLLKSGADPTISDSQGNTVMHYAVEKLDADIIEMFKSYLDEETVVKLANRENANGLTPLENLRSVSDERLRSNVFISLVRCGAAIKLMNSM